MKLYLRVTMIMMLILMSVSVGGFAETDVNGNIVFEDENLKYEILHSGVDLNNDEEISPSEALVLTNLSISNEELYSLEGIQYFENLTELEMNDIYGLNDLSPLSELGNLIDLELSECSIEDITPLEHLTNLEYLYLDNNDISDISPLSTLTSLRGLMIFDNAVTDISSLENLVNLEDLEIDGNQIEDISVIQNFEKLKELWINRNDIADVTPIVNLSSIQSLWIDGENLEDIEGTTVIKGLAELGVFGDFDETLLKSIYEDSAVVSLHLNDNTRSTLDCIQTFTSLNELTISGTDISDIDAVGYLENLEKLEIYYSPVSDISAVGTLLNLMALEIEKCPVSDISPLGHLGSLTSLWIEECDVSDISILGELTGLEEVELIENQINDISPLSSLPNLFDLDLYGNPINTESTPGAVHKEDLDFEINYDFYEVWVIEDPYDDTLYDLTSTAGDWDISFTPEVLDYTIHVDSDVDSIKLYPVATSTISDVYVDEILVKRGYSGEPIELPYGSTLIQIVVVSDFGYEKEYNLDILRLRDEIGSSKLKSLEVSQGTLSPVFKDSTTCYTVNVNNEVETVDIIPVADDYAAEITVNGQPLVETTSGAAVTIDLSVGANSVSVDVEDYSGNETTTYEVSIFREGSEDDTQTLLTDIRLSDGVLNPSFDENTYAYSASVANTVSNMTIWPTAKDPCVDVYVNDKKIENVTSGAAISLNVGLNDFDIDVKSTQSDQSTLYKLNITRAYPYVPDDDDDDDDRDRKTTNTSTSRSTSSTQSTNTDSEQSRVLSTSEIDTLVSQSITTSDSRTLNVETAIDSVDTVIGAIAKASADVDDETWAETLIDQITKTVEKNVLVMELDSESITNYAVSTVTALEKANISNQLVPTAKMKEAVESLGEQVSQKIGLIKPEVDIVLSGDTTQLKPKPASLVLDIQKQAREFKQMETALSNYYGASNVRDFEFEVTIDATDQTTPDVAVVLEKDVQESIKSTSVDRIAVQSNGVKLGIDKADFTGQADSQIRIALDDNPSRAPVPTRGVKKGVIADVRFYEDDIEKDVLAKPAVLKFDLSKFEFEDTRPIEALSDQLSIYRLNQEQGVWEPVGGKYDPISNTISTKRIHLSQYTVMTANVSLTESGTSEISQEVAALMNKGIIDQNTDFENENVTRAELASWVTRANGLSLSGEQVAFEDVNEGSAYYNDIASGYAAGLFAGRSETAFDPEGAVTREEMAVLLGKALAEYDQKAINNDLVVNLQALEDGESASDWSEDYLAMMVELDLLPLEEDRLNPQTTVTKEMAASILKKIYG